LTHSVLEVGESVVLCLVVDVVVWVLEGWLWVVVVSEGSCVEGV
jgi:hypothetical protein